MRSFLACLCLFIFAPIAAAQPTSLSLGSSADPSAFRDAVRAAVDNHPAVKSAIAQRNEAKQSRLEAKAGLLPRIGVGVTGQQEFASSFDDDPELLLERSRPEQRLDATLTGQQLLFDSGATFARMDAARQRMSEAEAQTQVAAAEIALQSIEAYLEVVQFGRLKVLGAELVDRHQDILSQVSERYDNGVGSIQDVSRVAARKATAQAQLAGFDRGLARAQSRYLQLFQAEPGIFDRPQLIQTEATSDDDKITLALTANPLLARAAANSRAVRLDQKAIERGNLPSVSVAVDATKFGVFEGDDRYDVRGRLVMDYDLFAGGARKAREKQAFQRTRQAQFNEDRTRQEVERDVRIALRDLEVLTAQLDTLDYALDANRDARDAFVEQFAVARGTLLDLLQAEADYFAAAIALLNGLLDRDMAHYELLAETGELLGAFGVTFSYASASDIWGPKN